VRDENARLHLSAQSEGTMFFPEILHCNSDWNQLPKLQVRIISCTLQFPNKQTFIENYKENYTDIAAKSCVNTCEKHSKYKLVVLSRQRLLVRNYPRKRQQDSTKGHRKNYE